MRLLRGALGLVLFFIAIAFAWSLLAGSHFLIPSFLPAPTSADQIPPNIAKAYRDRQYPQDPWATPSPASLQFCTNGFSAVYKLDTLAGDGKQEQVFATSGALLSYEYRGSIPEDNKVPAIATWYKLYGNCTDLAPLFKPE